MLLIFSQDDSTQRQINKNKCHLDVNFLINLQITLELRISCMRLNFPCRSRSTLGNVMYFKIYFCERTYSVAIRFPEGIWFTIIEKDFLWVLKLSSTSAISIWKHQDCGISETDLCILNSVIYSGKALCFITSKP